MLLLSKLSQNFPVLRYVNRPNFRGAEEGGKLWELSLNQIQNGQETSMLKETLNKNAKCFPLVFNARTASSFPVMYFI